MKILLAFPRAFCAGVDMAIATVERVLELFGTPLYVYHEIVHNVHVVGQFERRGVTFVDNLEKVPSGSHLVFSAHGVSPQIREQARQLCLHTIDATCPLVAKVHLEAVRYLNQGFTIVLIGHAGHDEVTGTLGEGPGRILLVESTGDVDRLALPNSTKVAYLTQTTLGVDDTKRIVDRLKERFPLIVGPSKDDICYATQNRQEALKALLPQAEITLILGSRNSSNSTRLLEIARETGKPAYLLDGVEEIETDWFRGNEQVLISAGASAPELSVQQCIAYLKEKYDAVVEEHSIRDEIAYFPLPVELRSEVEAMPQSEQKVFSPNYATNATSKPQMNSISERK